MRTQDHVLEAIAAHVEASGAVLIIDSESANTGRVYAVARGGLDRIGAVLCYAFQRGRFEFKVAGSNGTTVASFHEDDRVAQASPYDYVVGTIVEAVERIVDALLALTAEGAR